MSALGPCHAESAYSRSSARRLLTLNSSRTMMELMFSFTGLLRSKWNNLGRPPATSAPLLLGVEVRSLRSVLEWTLRMRQTVKAQISSNGEKSHESVSKEVH